MTHLSTRSKQNIFFFLGILLIFIIWFILTAFDDNIFFPGIDDTIIDIGRLLGESDSWLIIILTIAKALLLIITSFVVGFILAVLSYKISYIRSFISPAIAIMRSTPVASVILLLILLVGSKLAPYFISLLVIIPIAYENIYSSFKAIDNDVVDETKLISNINLKIILSVFVPISYNYLISSLLTCFGLTLKVLVMSEVLTQGHMTMGGSIQIAKSTLDLTRVFSWSIILVIIVLIVEALIKMCEKRIQKTKA